MLGLSISYICCTGLVKSHCRRVFSRLPSCFCLHLYLSPCAPAFVIPFLDVFTLHSLFFPFTHHTSLLGFGLHFPCPDSLPCSCCLFCGCITLMLLVCAILILLCAFLPGVFFLLLLPSFYNGPPSLCPIFGHLLFLSPYTPSAVCVPSMMCYVSLSPCCLSFLAVFLVSLSPLLIMFPCLPVVCHVSVVSCYLVPLVVSCFPVMSLLCYLVLSLLLFHVSLLCLCCVMLSCPSCCVMFPCYVSVVLCCLVPLVSCFSVMSLLCHVVLSLLLCHVSLLCLLCHVVLSLLLCHVSLSPCLSCLPVFGGLCCFPVMSPCLWWFMLFPCLLFVMFSCLPIVCFVHCHISLSPCLSCFPVSLFVMLPVSLFVMLPVSLLVMFPCFLVCHISLSHCHASCLICHASCLLVCPASCGL